MSYMVARMQKMKASNLGGAYRHNERVFENHSNKDIDTSRSHLNYELTDRERSVSYEKQIKDYVNKNKLSQRAIRKDAVLCDEWIITSDKAFFEKLDQEQTRAFFETAKNYFAENYGESNIAYASVHLDESTPHMHLGVVPMQDGKLSSKAMFDREELKHIQEDLPRYMSGHGFELERGELNSEAKHKTVAEFKQEMAGKEIERELVLEYGAPEYVNHEGKFVTAEEYQEAFETYQDLQGLFADFTWRETTVQEKMDWVKTHYQEELTQLEHAKKPLEDKINTLDEVLREKYDELVKVEQIASESLSELSRANEYINTLENEKDYLEAKIDRLERESLQLEKDKATKLEAKALNEGELKDLKPKKNLLGKEHYELTSEQFEGLKSEIYRSRTLLHHKDIELEQVKRQVPRRASRNAFEARLQSFKDKSKGEDLQTLKSENKALRREVSILRQQNNKMLDVLDKVLKPKEWEKLLDELAAIKPIVTVVKKVTQVIEKSLGL